MRHLTAFLSPFIPRVSVLRLVNRASAPSPFLSPRARHIARIFTSAMSPPGAKSGTAADSTTAATSPKLIGTHDGAFHCDEALAVHLLRQTPTYRDAAVLRTRDPEKLATANVVVDVGGVYDASIQRFDHHQRGFTETFSPTHTVTRLSSAGLVYRHFGLDVLRANAATRDLSPASLETLYTRIYNAFIEAVDAVDNGVSQGEGPPRYSNSTDLSARVGHLNAPWNAPADSPRANQDNNFASAVELVGEEFNDVVVRSAEIWLPARAIVEKAWRNRGEDCVTGEILVLREWAPWKGHLYDIESEEIATEKTLCKVLYIVYQDSTRASWRVQCVPVAPQSFSSRRPLPEPWRGVRDDKLSEISGISGCVFVHAAGFIGGNKTFEGAMQMARKALLCVEDKKVDVVTS